MKRRRWKNRSSSTWMMSLWDCNPWEKMLPKNKKKVYFKASESIYTWRYDCTRTHMAGGSSLASYFYFILFYYYLFCGMLFLIWDSKTLIVYTRLTAIVWRRNKFRPLLFTIMNVKYWSLFPLRELLGCKWVTFTAKPWWIQYLLYL